MAEKILTITDGAHSPLGPSSAKRWIHCPGSVRATAHLPSTSSEFAREGTAAHGVAEECEKLGVRADHFLGWTVRVVKDGESHDIECTQEMVDGVNVFLDYVDDLPGDSFCEMTVRYDHLVPEGFGTLDRAKVDGTIVHIVDFKYGKGVPVPVEDNEQLKIYALGFLHENYWLYDVYGFVLHIVQPRLDYAERWTISLADLLTWGNTILAPAAEQTAREGAPFAAGEWCQFCKLRATCRTRAESVFSAMLGEFEDLDAAIGTEPRPLGTLTNEQIGRILVTRPNAVKWFEDIKTYALKELAAGRPVAGWKVVEGRSSRQWNLAEAEMANALVEAGVKKAELYTYELIGVPAAEKILGKKHEVLKTHVVKPPGSPTLAPTDDKRPAITVDPAIEFDNLDT